MKPPMNTPHDPAGLAHPDGGARQGTATGAPADAPGTGTAVADDAPVAGASDAFAPAAGATIHTLCTYCGVGDPLAIEAGTLKLRAAGPLGACVKGARFVHGNRDRPRIEAPQLKHRGRWRTVTWEEAYTAIATNLLKLRAKHGRQSIAYYGVGQLTIESMWLAKKLFQGYLGTNNVGSNAELCLASSAGGHELVFGNEGSFSCYEDYVHAEAIVLYGSNQLINHPTIFDRYFMGNKDAVKVAIDPRVTETVRKILDAAPERNLHVRVRSRGDVRLNLSIAHELFRRGWVARDYVARHVEPDALAAFAAEVQKPEYAPAEVAKAIAVDADGVPVLARQIERLAELFATARVATTSSVGINQTSGSEGVASILNLHLLTQNLGEPGRGHVRLAGQSNASSELAMGFNCKLLPFRLKVESRRDRVRMGHLWDTPPWSIHPVRGVNVTDYPRAAHLKFFLIQGTDFVRNFPDLAAWHAKLRASYVVFCDPFEVPGARDLADVLLPARTHAEMDGSYLNGERRFQALRRVAEPPVDARSDVTILVELAQELARHLVSFDQQITDINEQYLENRRRSWWSTLLPWDRERRYPDGAPELPEIERRVRQGNRDIDPRPIKRNFAYRTTPDGEIAAEAVWEELLRASRGMYNEFTDGEGRPIDWARMTTARGVLWGGARRYLKDQVSPEPGDTGAIFERRFKSELGRARLVLPREELRHPVPVGGARFNLITGRGTIGPDAAKYGVRVFNSGLKAGGDEPARHAVHMHPADAARLGIADGDRIAIENHLGRLEYPVALAIEVPPGHLFLSFYPDRERRTPNLIVPSDRYDPHVFQPTIKILEVDVVRVGGAGG